MLFRFTRLWTSIGLMLALWGVTAMRRSEGLLRMHPVGSPPGPVRILQFYATVGALTPGEKAQLCYGVENAKSVQIAPPLVGIYPATRRCVDVVPEHTTHYTIMAEGFDGRVAMQSLTLPVQAHPPARREWVQYAAI